MREQPDAWTELRHDLDTQKALLAALAEGSERPLSERLGELPVHGAVQVQSQTWDYTRHGAGVSLHLRQSERRIDVADNVDHPERFDHWRLVIYFGSLGRTGSKLRERASGRRGVSASRALDLLLSSWQASGAVVVTLDGALMLAPKTSGNGHCSTQ